MDYREDHNKTVFSGSRELLKLDKSMQILQKLDVVLLFQSCAVIKKPLAKVIVDSPFSQHVQQHYIQILLWQKKMFKFFFVCVWK